MGRTARGDVEIAGKLRHFAHQLHQPAMAAVHGARLAMVLGRAADLIDAGQVNVQIGICPVKPAEFVIFSIGQWDGGALIEE